MSSPCQHGRTKTIATRGFSGPVSREENRAAHGNVCVTSECLGCGAQRDVNVNGCHTETGSWGPTRREREDRAIAAEQQVDALLATAHPVTLHDAAGHSATVRIDDEGYLTVTGDVQPSGEQIAQAAPAFVSRAQAVRRAAEQARRLRAEV